MKKVLVYGALCALTLAIPAAAEKVYVPVLGATKLWVASADGVDRAVPTGRVGLVAVDADAYENVRAVLDDRLEVPAFTEEETYQAGLEVPLADLPRPREMKSLTVGAANLSEQTASCQATLSRPDGSRLGEVQFDVEPMSLARRDALAAVGGGRIGSVTITCDQSFYPLAIATQGSGKPAIIAKGNGPNGKCTYYLNILQQPNGHWATAQQGVFHEATKADPKGIVCLAASQDLRIGKAVYEWDVYVGPWSPRDKSGIHNLGYFFLDRYRSGVIGNVNALGPNKSLLKIMQNVSMPAGSNTNAKASYLMVQGQTYHVIYTYDATNKRATMQLQLNGQTVSNFGLNSQPGNNQTLVFKRFSAAGYVGLISSNEFGNYTNQHHPEEATIGWKYSNFKLDMTPK
ncbi:MAG TPA: hypothetical protein VGM86_30245 [Thermoanaerobaculia bacterium]|jgi:hypothetical protein